MSEIIRCNVSNDKISSDEWNHIEEHMHPEDRSEVGFLEQKQKLKKVIDEDEKTLQRLGITYGQIADSLTHIKTQYYFLSDLIRKEIKESKYINMICGEDTLSWTLKIESNLIVSCVSYKGTQECPFQNHKLDFRYHGNKYGNTDFTVKNMDLNESFTFNTLLPHMIEAHHFFGGSVSYRVDPETVIRVLNIKCAQKYKYKSKWFSSSNCNFLHWGDVSTEKAFEAIKYYSLGHKNLIINTKQDYSLCVDAFLILEENSLLTEGDIAVYLAAYEKKASYKEFRKMMYEKDNVKYKGYNKCHNAEKGDSLYFEILSESEINEKCEKYDRLYLKQKDSLNVDTLFVHMIIGKIKNDDSDHTNSGRFTNHKFFLFGPEAIISDDKGRFQNYDYYVLKKDPCMYGYPDL